VPFVPVVAGPVQQFHLVKSQKIAFCLLSKSFQSAFEIFESFQNAIFERRKKAIFVI
jgi:hypothetical protein